MTHPAQTHPTQTHPTPADRAPVRRVAIVIPALNAARYIERALCSVLDQALPEGVSTDIVVVDGGSRDNTPQLVEFYAEDGVRLFETPGLNTPESINHGVARTRGEAVIALAADDVLEPDAVASYVNALNRRPGADALVAPGQRIDAHDRVTGRFACSAPSSLSGLLRYASGVAALSGMAIRRAALQRCEGFHERCPLAYGFDLLCRLVAAGLGVQAIDTVTFRKREYPDRRGERLCVEHGIELTRVAAAFSARVRLENRYALVKQIEERARLYLHARDAGRHDPTQAFLWRRLLARPWWLQADRYRASLLTAVERQPTSMPMLDEPARPAPRRKAA